MKSILVTFATAILVFCIETAYAQSIRGGGNPYSSQLITDPDAGTIQGIQRYGKPLPADPFRGSAYPYFVFPSVTNPGKSSPFSGSPTIRLAPSQQRQLQQRLQGIQAMRRENERAAETQMRGLDTSGVDRSATSQANSNSGDLGFSAFGQTVLSMFGADGVSPQSMQTGTAFESAALSNSLYAAPAAPIFVPGRSPEPHSGNAFIQHQPLVQIKLRVVEVIRDDVLAVSSTLDYIQRRRGIASEFDGRMVPNINNSQRNLTGVSRFNVTGLINVANGATALSSTAPTGSGALVNLSTKRINWIASLLADELEADVLTAPELVTTNGQSVEFVAGSKDPFTLGTVQTGGTNAQVQNHVFYKHIGTYLKITPRIVNYGPYGVGRGDAAIVASDVAQWNTLIRFLLEEGFITVTEPDPEALKERIAFEVANPDAKTTSAETELQAKKNFVLELRPFTRNGRLVPLEIKTRVLDLVNQFTRSDLRAYITRRAGEDSGFQFDYFEMICDCDDGDCDWKPEDCTIDLEVVARFSGKGGGTNAAQPTGDPTANPIDLTNVNTESDVRAIANIVQIKNGTGLVMAGLLGESDVEAIAKVPVLGDLPALGPLFRAKSVSRQKSEILIFIEAKILSHDVDLARSESSEDLHLAAPYVSAGTLDNPLEIGMHRAGFGTYLPPVSPEEQQYWERHSRRVNRIKTTLHDALR